MSKMVPVFQNIDKKRNEMIKLQSVLTAIPAIAPESGGKGEWQKAELLKKHLIRLGLRRIEQLDAPDKRVTHGKRPNIIVTVPGKSTEKTFWIMTHLDVVPAGDMGQWWNDPFKVVKKRGKLFGRGVEDNQQGLVASVFAAHALLESNFLPCCTVKLLFVADEETGSDYGIKYLLKKYPRLFKKQDFVLVPDAGESNGTMIEIAEKSILWLKIHTKGKQCHASLPHLGKNAFIASSELVLKCNELNTQYTAKNPLFTPPYSTFSPTKKEANVPNINTIPGDDVFYIDCRILPRIELDEILAKINAIAAQIEKKHGVKIKIEIIQRESSPPTGENIPLVQSLKKAIHNVYGVKGKVVGIGGGTVGAHLRKQGIDTVVWSKLDSTAHMPNEYCVIDNMIGDAKVMACIMLGD